MKSAGVEERKLRRCDELALEAALGWESLPTPTPAVPAVKAVPTNAELCHKAAELGLPLPPRRRIREFDAIKAEARDDMLACLRFELRDEQAGHRC